MRKKIIVLTIAVHCRKWHRTRAPDRGGRKPKTKNQTKKMNYLTVIREQDSLTRYVISATPVPSLDEARAEIREHFAVTAKEYAKEHRTYGTCIGIDYYIIPAVTVDVEEGRPPRISKDDWDAAEYQEIWSGTLSERIGNSTMHRATADLRKVEIA